MKPRTPFLDFTVVALRDRLPSVGVCMGVVLLLLVYSLDGPDGRASLGSA